MVAERKRRGRRTAPADAADDRELGAPRSEPRAREAADEANLEAHRDEPPFNS